MTRLGAIEWLTDAQRKILSVHRVKTLEDLASLEMADSFADVAPLPNLRALARRARKTLGNVDPMSRIGAAAGAKYPVYAGGIKRG